MKKFSILLLSALAMICATSCEEELIPAEPQSNPQEALVSFDGLTVAVGSDISAALDLSLASDSITVISTSATPELEEGQTIEYIAYVATSEDFSDAVKFETTNGKIAVADLDTQFRTFYGQSPSAKDLYFQFAAYIADGDNKVRFGSSDTYFALTQVSVTPIPLDITIEDAYYLIGDHCSWDITAPTPFEHSDKDVYDDPVFSMVVEITSDNSYWKIVPKSSFDASSWDGLLGVEENGSTETSGTIVSEDAQAGMIEKAGIYSFTINMMDGTYSYSEVQPYLYLIGTPNGWDIDSDACMLESVDLDNIYVGTFTFLGEDNYFRFYKELGNWDAAAIGADASGDVNITLEEVDGEYSGTLVDGSGNFIVPLTAEGVYKVTANLTAMTLKIVPAGSAAYIYAVGNINGWTTDGTAEGAKDGALASATDNGIYTGTLTLPDSGDGEYSYFRFYKDLTGDWDSGSIGTATSENELVEVGADGIAMFEITVGNQGAFMAPIGTYDFTVDTNESIVVLTVVE